MTTRRLTMILTVTTLTVMPALVGLAGHAMANPDFGSPEFQIFLQRDLGLVGPSDREAGACPTVRGVPMPRSWGRDWWPANDWVQYVKRHGHPPNRGRCVETETPDQKWKKTVRRYRAFLINHPYDGSHRWDIRHSHFLEYLEQNWYNYWHRLRYGKNPPNHDSNYHGWGYGREGH
ncbi:MAG: hypothetical protein ACP5KN_03160 [Armatimonadota bacterium]